MRGWWKNRWNHWSVCWRVQVTLVIRGGRVPANLHIYRKHITRGTYNMPLDFVIDTPWEALICSNRSQNGGQVSETARAIQ
jgi:hypothetical protein